MPFDHKEALRIRANLLVGRQRHADTLHAVGLSALADELGRVADKAEPLAQLPKALIHLAEDDLVLANMFGVFVHPPKLSAELGDEALVKRL